jgi:hypothetical protein
MDETAKKATKVGDVVVPDAKDDIIDEIKGTVVIVNTQQGKKAFDIGKLFIIDENNLTAEFVRQAASYAFFATLVAGAERNVAKRDMLKDQEYSAADEDSRKRFIESGEKFTEAVIKSQILLDADYQDSVTNLEAAKYELNLLKALTKAYEQKGMMLQSLGSHLRSELSMVGMHVNEAEIGKSVKDVKEVISKRRDKAE